MDERLRTPAEIRASRPIWVGLTILFLMGIQAVVVGTLSGARLEHVAHLDALARAREIAAASLARGPKADLGPGLPEGAVGLRIQGGEQDEYGIRRGLEITARSGSGWPADAEPLLAKVRGLEAGAEPVTLLHEGRVVVLALAPWGGAVAVALRPARTDLGPYPAIALLLCILAALLAMYRRLARPALGAGLLLLVGAAMWALQRAGGSGDLLGGQALLPVACFGGVLGFLLWLAGPGAIAVVRGIAFRPTAYAYTAPAMVGMLICVFLPFVMGIGIAFFTTEGEFVGLQNFAEIIRPPETADMNFYLTLGVTVLWTVLNVALHVVIGLSLALTLNRPKLRFRGLYRVLLILPWAVPNYITALIWKGMFHTQYGAINDMVAWLTGSSGDPIVWLGHNGSFLTNFCANLVTNTWLGFPFMMVVALGALQSIPKDLYEAAEIDGASRWQRFRHVTLPLLKPALFPAIILGSIWTFNMFNVIYLVSGGAPANETNILITEAYRAFDVLKRFGMAAAYSLLIFLILLTYTLVTNRWTGATQGAFDD